MPECVKVEPGATKRCTKCGVVKGVEEYHNYRRRGRVYKKPHCKVCCKREAKAWIASNRGRYNARVAQYRDENPLRVLLVYARDRAKKLGLPFNLTTKDLVIPSRCPVLGIPLRRASGGRITDGSPSLDRLIPNLGYVPGNVSVISYKANRIKTNGTPEEVLAVANWMLAQQSKTPAAPGVVVGANHPAASATGTEG